MFTGIIQATATIKAVTPYRLQVIYTPADSSSTWDSEVTSAFADLALGDSVAVDGVCLTVTAWNDRGFTADVSPETLQRTTLGEAAERGTLVNLETSLRVGGKLGGHWVTGHIDGTGYFESAIATATSWEVSLQIQDAQISRYIVPKGSLAVNGISLTIANCNADGTWLNLAVIPHTYEITNLSTLEPGQAVNLEADILGKYVEKLLNRGHSAHNTELYLSGAAQLDITPEFLAEQGYL